MDDLGAEIVPDATNTPEALQAHLKSEIDKWGPVIRAGGKFAD
jgi:tripartite-type tricarboxylate transporter receptor subunit TctC